MAHGTKRLLATCAIALAVLSLTGCRAASTDGELVSGDAFTFSSGITLVVPAGWIGDWYKADPATIDPQSDEYETLFMGPLNDGSGEHATLNALPSRESALEVMQLDRRLWGVSRSGDNGSQESTSSGLLSLETSAGPVFARLVRNDPSLAPEAMPFVLDAWVDHTGEQPLRISCGLDTLPPGVSGETDDTATVRQLLEHFGLAR